MVKNLFEMNRSDDMDLYKLLKQIDYERLAGSDGEKKARTTFKGYLKSWGCKFTEHSFDMHTFVTGTAEIVAEEESFTALPLGLVKTIDVTAELYFMENSEELFCQRGNFQGKIIMTNTRSAKLADRIKEEGIVGIIYIAQPYRGLLATNLRQKAYEDNAVPAVVVSYDDAKCLSQLCGQQITINVSQSIKKKKATNLVVDIPGTSADKVLTVICAHYDTVATSHGANDNGAGSVILLKIAEHFAKNPPARDLRIIFFTGEEMGLLGSYAYTKDHKDELKSRMGLLINVDVSGDDLGVNAFECLGTNELLGYVDGIFKENGLVFQKKLDIYSSDCIPFSIYEIPSINLARWGGESTFHIHTAADTAAKCSQRGLETTYLATKILCDRLLNAQLYPVKPFEIDGSLRDKLEAYIYNSSKAEPKLEWKKKYEK
jgi:hypothetical protein